MNYRIAEIMSPEDLGASGTKVIEIAVTDPISRITVCFQPVGGSDTIIAHPTKSISKLELVDGSDVLFSLSGFEAQALNILEAPVPVSQYLDLRNGGTPMININIDFGRFLWDPELALDPSKFKNLQLKLTWNEALWDASCATHSFFIYGHLFDEKTIVPVGFLTNKEIKSYTPVSGGYEYTDMPTDHIIRKLMIQAFKKSWGVRGLCEHIKLSENNDKRIPIDADEYYLRQLLDYVTGEAVDIIRINAAADADECYVTPHNVLSAVGVLDTADKACRVYLYPGGYVIVESETAAYGMNLTVRGKNPHGCMAIPFGNQADTQDWYDVTPLGSLKLRIKGGTGSATGDAINIVTQQLRLY